MAGIDYTALEAELTRDADVNSSAATLLAAISAGLADAIAGGQAKVQEFADRLKAQSDSLAAAVAASTPADPGLRKG